MLRLYDVMARLVNYLLLRCCRKIVIHLQHTLLRTLIPIVAVLGIYAYIILAMQIYFSAHTYIWILRLVVYISYIRFFLDKARAKSLKIFADYNIKKIIYILTETCSSHFSLITTRIIYYCFTSLVFRNRSPRGLFHNLFIRCKSLACRLSSLPSALLYSRFSSYTRRTSSQTD